MGGGGEMRMLLTGGRVGSFEGAGVLVFDGLGSRWVLRARRLRPSRGAVVGHPAHVDVRCE